MFIIYENRPIGLIYYISLKIHIDFITLTYEILILLPVVVNIIYYIIPHIIYVVCNVKFTIWINSHIKINTYIYSGIPKLIHIVNTWRICTGISIDIYTRVCVRSEKINARTNAQILLLKIPHTHNTHTQNVNLNSYYGTVPVPYRTLELSCMSCSTRTDTTQNPRWIFLWQFKQP